MTPHTMRIYWIVFVAIVAIFMTPLLANVGGVMQKIKSIADGLVVIGIIAVVVFGVAFSSPNGAPSQST